MLVVGQPKQADQGSWAKKLGGADASILYRIDEVAAAIEAGQMICIVEGGRTRTICGVSVSPRRATLMVQVSLAKSRNGRRRTCNCLVLDTVVFNDNDPPGYAHAETASKLSRRRQRAAVIDPKLHWPEMPEGKDVSDWLQVGGPHTPERLRELIESAPDCTAEQSPPR